MKFYFCESCGKRVTDENLAEGSARDKKLRGVYCTDCGIGVTTMETLPLKESEAREILVKEGGSGRAASGTRPASARGSGTHRTARRTSSRSTLPAHQRTGDASQSKRHQLDSPQQSSKRPLIIGAGVAGFVVIIGAWVALSGGSSPVTPQESTKRTSKPEALPKETKLVQTRPGSGTAEGVTPTPRSSGTDAVPAQSDADDHKPATEPETPTPLAEQAPVAEDPDKKAADAAKAREAEEAARKAREAEEAARKAREAEERLERAREKLTGHFQAFFDALAARDMGALDHVLGKARDDSGIEPVQGEVDGMASVLEAHKRAEAARKKTIDQLKDGKVREFMTTKGKIKGTVSKIEGDVLRVSVTGKINNNTFSYEKQVALKDLKPSCRAQLFGKPNPQSPDEWVLFALHRMAKDELDAAGEALKSAEAHALSCVCVAKLASLRAEALEERAEQFWAERLAPHLKVEKVKFLDAKKAGKDLAVFAKTFGATLTAKALQPQRMQLRKRLDKALGKGGTKAKAATLSPNPEYPPTSSPDRLGADAFFKRVAGKELKLCPSLLTPDKDLGVFRPGSKIPRVAWIVKVKDGKEALAPDQNLIPRMTMDCEVPESDAKQKAKRVRFTDRLRFYRTVYHLTFQLPFSSPPGNHYLRVVWNHPKHWPQKLEEAWSISIDNPYYGQTEDAQIAQLIREHGPRKVVVLQNGRVINRLVYQGVRDLELTWGGCAGDRTTQITPQSPTLGMGCWLVNGRAAWYARGMIRFDLRPLQGRRVQQAWLKLTVRPQQAYLPDKMKGNMPIYPLLKEWKEGKKYRYWVDSRGGGMGMPNTDHYAYPKKWGKRLASDETDRGPQMATLEPESGVNVLPGAKADVTEMVNEWLSGKRPNHGFLINKDLPSDLAGIHPGTDMGKYKAFYPHGLIPFYASQEHNDKDFRPRLIIVLK